MATQHLSCSLLAKPRILSSLFTRSFRSFSLSSSASLSTPSRSASSLLHRLRPLVAATSVLNLRRTYPDLTVRGLSTRATSSSLNDPNPNWSNRPPKETILLDGCDFEHWLVVMEKPEGEPTRDEIIDSYIKTLAKVVGSEEEARMKIYSVSTRCYYAFGALVSEELSYKIKELPGVRWVLPDSYLDVKNKDYGGEPFVNGQAVPYDPKYHEEWIRNNARANERNRRNDRPRNFDRSRNFERRRENMQNRESPPMAGPPPTPSNMGNMPPPPSNMGSMPPPPNNMGTMPPPRNNMGSMPPPPNNMGSMPPPPNNMGSMPPPPNNMGGMSSNYNAGMPPGGGWSNNMGGMPPPPNNMGGMPPPSNNMGGRPPPSNNMGGMPQNNNAGMPGGGWSNNTPRNVQNFPNRDGPANNGSMPYQGAPTPQCQNVPNPQYQQNVPNPQYQNNYSPNRDMGSMPSGNPPYQS